VADRVAFLYETNLEWVGTVEDLHRSTNPNLNSFVKASEYQIGAPSAAPSLSGSSA
jgi:phospholipid/cholesterol/gamma-HCH transport system ATP-binding protein